MPQFSQIHPGVLPLTCHPRTWEPETGGSKFPHQTLSTLARPCSHTNTRKGWGYSMEVESLWVHPQETHTCVHTPHTHTHAHTLAQRSQIWALRSTSRCVLCPFARSPSWYERSLSLWHKGMLGGGGMSPARGGAPLRERMQERPGGRYVCACASTRVHLDSPVYV